MAKVHPPQPQAKHPYITRHKAICGGRPVIAGTRIKVAQIALEYDRLGWSADEILQAHPHLTLAQIHGALSYHYENAEAINAEMQADEKLIEEIRKQNSKSVLRKNLDTPSSSHGASAFRRAFWQSTTTLEAL